MRAPSSTISIAMAATAPIRSSFSARASQRTKTMRLVTGAVLPVFNHPFKLAGEIAMLDGISGGRLDVGFARAFLLHEFRRFGISPDESQARFREGLEQIELLLTQENGHPPRPVPFVRERHLAAAADAEAAAEVLYRRHPDAGIVRVRGQQGLLADGDPDRADRRPDRALSQVMARGGTPRRRRGHGGVPHVLPRGPEARARDRARRRSRSISARSTRRRATGSAVRRRTTATTTHRCAGCARSRSRGRSKRAAPGSARRTKSRRSSARFSARSASSSTPRCRSTSAHIDIADAQKSMRLFAREVMPEFADAAPSQQDRSLAQA